jgi:N-acyl-D-aspartate/D-glutamate deacylase
MANRLVLKNGGVIDGSGTPAVTSDLLIEDGLIQGVGRFRDLVDTTEIDLQPRLSGTAGSPPFRRQRIVVP